jgi:transcriptional regulator with XRE-family HTH domain
MSMPSITNKADTPAVGKRIRLLREQRGLSLRALAERCGLSLNAISKIEHGENSPTVASLHQLAKALEVPITAFFHNEVEKTTVYVKKADRVQSERHGIRLESLGSGLRNQQLEPFVFTLEPNHSENAEWITHTGQEFVYCFAGTVEYRVSDSVYMLEPGDSLIFEAIQPHCFRNIGSDSAMLLLVYQTANGNQNGGYNHLNP